MVVDTTNTFLQGERVEQGSSYGLVSLDGWRTGSNILKVSVQNGEFVVETLHIWCFWNYR